MYLGVRAVLAKSIERIHKANLINFAIVPIEFTNPADYDKIKEGDELEISDLTAAIQNAQEVEIFNRTTGEVFKGRLALSPREREILLSAGLLNYIKKKVRPS
jgi:aconitate hydratase